MADTAARLAISARRNEVARFTIAVTGIDMTGVAMAMQIRLGRDVPGAPLISLATVTTLAAEGLKLDSVTTANGVPTSVIKGRINASTMTDATKVPYTGEVGDNTVLAYAMQWTIAGDAQTRLYGDFIVVASAFGSDGAPTNRPASYGASSATCGGSSSGSLTFGDQVIAITLASSDLVGLEVAKAAAASATAISARDSILNNAGFITVSTDLLLGATSKIAIVAGGIVSINAVAADLSLGASGSFIRRAPQAAMDAAASAASVASSATQFKATAAAFYGIVLGPDGGAVWDLSRWRTTVFQDIAATVPVTADGQPVGCIRNVLGDQTWDLVAPSVAARPTFQLIDGIPSVLPAANQGLLTRGVHSVATPFHLLGAISRVSEAFRVRMGLMSRQSLYHGFAPTTLGRYAANTNIGGQVKNIAPPFYTSRVGTWSVHDTLVKDQQADMRTNGESRFLATVPVALAAAAGTVVPTAIIGVNISEQANIGQPTGTPYSDAGATFYGGSFIVGEPSQATRDGLVRYFRAQVEPEIRATDKVIFIDGDSTGDGVDESTSDIGQELFERWASETTSGYLRSVYPNDTIYYRNWTSRAQQWVGWMRTQVGTSGRRIFVSNSSVPGSQPSYLMADRFADVFGVHHHIDEIIWNHGQNLFVNYTAVTGANAKYLRAGEWMDAMDKVRRAYPNAPHLAIRCHPVGTIGNESMQAVVAALDFVAAEYGDLALADIYTYFDNAGRPSAWYNADKVHIAEPAGVTAQLDVFAPAYANWARPAIVAPARRSMSATNILANGRFDDFDGAVPTGWTKAGGSGTVARSTQQVDIERGDNSSVRMDNATYLEQVIDATPYRGQAVTLAVRQFVSVGTSADRGRILLASNGTGAVPLGNSSYDTAGKAVDAWRWVYEMAFVPTDATTITARVYGTATGTGTVYYARAILVAGTKPKDLR